MLQYECERVKCVVRDAIQQFFHHELQNPNSFSIDAMIGVSMEQRGMFYITLNEVIEADRLITAQTSKQSPEQALIPTKRKRGRPKKQKLNTESVVGSISNRVTPSNDTNEFLYELTSYQTEDSDDQKHVSIKQEAPEDMEESSIDDGQDHDDSYSEIINAQLDRDLLASTNHQSAFNSTANQQLISGSYNEAIARNSPLGVDLNLPESDNTSTPKRCSYTMEFKLQAVQYAKQTNKSAAARTFNVARKRIHDWCKQEAVLEQQIRSAAGNRKKVEGGGCRPMYTALERSLAAWVREERDQGTTITGQVIATRAKQLAVETTDQDMSQFKASGHWVTRFLARYNLTSKGADVSNEATLENTYSEDNHRSLMDQPPCTVSPSSASYTGLSPLPGPSLGQSEPSDTAASTEDSPDS